MSDMRGNTIGLLGIVTIVSERKSVEDALWHSERRYHMLMHRASDAIVVTDMDGKL
jgi:PAS domain-containing protein